MCKISDMFMVWQTALDNDFNKSKHVVLKTEFSLRVVVTENIECVGRIWSFPLSISFHHGSPCSYNLGDEKYSHLWQQFIDVASPHRHDNHHQTGCWCALLSFCAYKYTSDNFVSFESSCNFSWIRSNHYYIADKKQCQFGKQGFGTTMFIQRLGHLVDYRGSIPGSGSDFSPRQSDHAASYLMGTGSYNPGIKVVGGWN
jgi:hypothetical protein